jgi:copper(I)-binding protein
MSALRAALAPVAAAAVTLGGLALWAVSGHAGRPARVHVWSAWVMTPTAPRTAAYFTLANTGDVADELLEVRSPAAAMAMLGRQVERAGAERMAMGGTLTVPAHGTVRMTPFTVNVMLQPRTALPTGWIVPFTLVFRHSGTVHTNAEVVPPGSRA